MHRHRALLLRMACPPPRSQTEIVQATNDEIEHLWTYVLNQANAAEAT